jgi:hypothetical protein
MVIVLKVRIRLDRVSTGSGSDLVCDRHAIFGRILSSNVDQVAAAPCTDPIQFRNVMVNSEMQRIQNYGPGDLL